MSSAAKTLDLLTHFSVLRPEIGLSQFCRLAKRDKATTYRHLQALEAAGFIEKNPQTRQYRLGPALLPLAQLREDTVPRKAGVQAPLTALAEAIGETAHVSILSGQTLYPLLTVESPQHSTRAIVDLATLPLHATASGLCALAFGPANLIDHALRNAQKFTPYTPVTQADLDAGIALTRQTGFAKSDGGYDVEIYSRSAPIFDQTGTLAGTVSVACVASRVTDRVEQAITHHLASASRQISHNWGGSIPAALSACWDAALTPPHQLDAAT